MSKVSSQSIFKKKKKEPNKKKANQQLQSHLKIGFQKVKDIHLCTLTSIYSFCKAFISSLGK